MPKLAYKKIAVAVDLSEPSLTALETAKALARRWSSSLELVYVFEYPPAYGFGGEETMALRSQWEEHGKWVRSELEKRMRDFPASKYACRILEGSAAMVLERFVKKQGVDLLTTGTHGYTGMRHALYGSVAESVVRSSSVPVLTVHADRPLTVPKRVLLPFNQERYAEAALIAGLDWCDAFAACPTVFQVVEDPAEEVATYVQLKARVAALSAKRRGAEPKIVVRTGDPQRAILEETRFGGHDLLVMAAHHKAFWEDLVLGTTAERVLRHCEIPVLSLRSQERRRVVKKKKKKVKKRR
jgi:nucleotide-binding universal stress UspA family protein